ncbi:hypothetical protein D6C80_02548 [Aureobasidium pullulans]|nr:hypothetical protein D6C95_07961 [Aureobasidium pullulans]TIA20121.1 hypothetical protein D6C80_02548 [Aureobasidium pullulans]
MATSSAGVFNASKLAIIFALLCSLYLFRDIWLPSSPTTPVHATSTASTPQSSAPHETESAHNHTLISQHVDCLNAPGADRVMIVLKTGASEIYEKLPTHLITLFRCTQHYLIFSDLPQTYSDYQIHDALDTVSPKYKDDHEDFEMYRKLQKYQREGQNVAKLKGEKGWSLDKWKFLPMMHESYRLASPDVDWFVYIEADTSLSWTNLLQFLGRMDPRKPLYLGAQNVIGPTTFAHGGSGFIISRGAAKRIEDRRRKMGARAYDDRWELSTSLSCCGDEVVARALVEVDVDLTPSWPRLQGETVDTLDWTEKHWCTPAITWHHVSPSQVDSMWRFQNEWVKENGWSKPYLYRDVFDGFVARHISVNRTSWNNLSKDREFIAPDGDSSEKSRESWEKLSDVEKNSVKSFDSCAEACLAWDHCIQFMHENGVCKLGKDVRLGETDERHNSGNTWSSGWIQDRIQGMRDDLANCNTNWNH